MLIDKAYISDALIERPISFSVRKKHYSLYPASLGKIQLTARLLEAIGLTEGNAYKQALEAVKIHREECLRLVAYSTLPGDECLDENKVCRRIKELEPADETDLATLLVVILTSDKTADIKKEFGMDKEEQRLNKVIKAKKASKENNSLSFGGKSIWGSIVDVACERYGWSYQYVLWGISFCALQLLMSDRVKTVLLSKEEMKAAHVSTDAVVVRADDRTALESFIKTQSWK